MTIVDAVRACMADPRLAMKPTATQAMFRILDVGTPKRRKPVFVPLADSTRGMIYPEDCLNTWMTFEWEGL